MELLIVIVPALPLLAAAVANLLPGGKRKQIASLSVMAIALTFAASIALLTLALYGNPVTEVRIGGSWGILMFDPLSSLMSVLISGISLIVHVYSTRYMADEEGYKRYFVLLSLINSAQAG